MNKLTLTSNLAVHYLNLLEVLPVEDFDLCSPANIHGRLIAAAHERTRRRILREG